MLQLSLLTKPRHVIPISGKDSLATALIQTTEHPQINYEFIFNDTGAELPEVYQWLSLIEAKTDWSIKRIGANLEDRIRSYGGFLPSAHGRYCTRDGKIKPTDIYLGNDPVYAYYGLRADEDRVGYIPTNKSNIHPVYPLRERGLGIAHVYAILEAQGMTPPNFFWQRAYDAVCDRIPPDRWVHKLESWQLKVLFAGRTRGNCYFCFFQRQAELLWLWEVHPDYFYRAKSFEKSDFTWLQDCPLTNYDDPAFRERVFHRHITKLCNVLQGKGKASLDSEISRTSCGLICGK